MCSQANTAEAWVPDLAPLYDRVTHICSVDVCPTKFMATQHASCEGNLEGQKSCGSLPHCQPWGKGDHQKPEPLHWQHLEFGSDLPRILSHQYFSLSQQASWMCSVFIVLMPCNCCLLQPSVYPYHTLGINKVLLPFFLIFFAPQ